MISLFKKAKFIYFGLMAIGIGPILVDNVQINGRYIRLFGFEPLSDFWTLVLIFLWIVLSKIIAYTYAVKRLNKVLASLTDECDPEKCVASYKTIIKQKNLKKSVVTFLLLSLSNALREAGKKEEAMKLLKGINNFPNNKFGNEYKAVYFSYLFSTYIENGELENASYALDNMKNTLKSSKLSEVSRQRYYNVYIQRQSLLKIKKGNFDGAEDIFKLMFEVAKNNYERVSAKLTLGIIYLHYGKQAEAKEAFEFVVSNGNKLSKVDEAKGYLETIL